MRCYIFQINAVKADHLIHVQPFVCLAAEILKVALRWT